MVSHPRPFFNLFPVCEHQLGRRNITDDQRAVLANEVREYRAEISRAEQARRVGKQGGRGKKKTQQAESTRRVSSKKGVVRPSVAKAAKLPERKLRLAQEIKKADEKHPASGLVDRVRAGQLTLVEAKRLARLEGEARRAGAVNF